VILASNELSSGSGAVVASGVTTGGLVVSLAAGGVIGLLALDLVPRFLLPEARVFSAVPVPVTEEQAAKL